jgi:transcription elongation GreA/GreB family factor
MYSTEQHQLIRTLALAGLASPQAQASVAVAKSLVALAEDAENIIAHEQQAAQARQVLAEAERIQAARKGTKS